MSEVKRYPLARQRTARIRDLRNATSSKLAVTKLISAKVASKVGIRASRRGIGTRINGATTQNATNSAMMTTSAPRLAPRDADAVTRSGSDTFDVRRSLIALRWFRGYQENLSDRHG